MILFRRGFVLSLLLILPCSLSPVLGERGEGWGKGLEYEVLRCIDECDNTDIREYLLCQRDCELGYGARGHEEEQQHGGRGMDPRWQPRPGRERIPKRTRESEYERCLRRCESEGPGGRGREGRWRRCEDQCEELLRPRERRRGWERERERIPRRTDPQSEYERCLRRCEYEGPGGRGREARWRQCGDQCEELLRPRKQRRDWERERERIPRRTGPQSEYERCLQRCEYEGPGGRGREGRRWQKCEDQCEELLRARERKRDWEREREILISDDQTSTTESKERFERCMRQCELHPGGQQRQLCKFRCQQQQRQRDEGPGEEVNYLPGGGEEKIKGGNGTANILNEMNKEAEQVAYDFAAQEMDRAFDSQDGSHSVPAATSEGEPEERTMGSNLDLV
ncbi:hypothetical protein CDL15_Pgr008620 [Punica granatum]|nr:hypothetical protein CDL15_Pgr008620 [Punica granatum]